MEMLLGGHWSSRTCTFDTLSCVHIFCLGPAGYFIGPAIWVLLNESMCYSVCVGTVGTFDTLSCVHIFCLGPAGYCTGPAICPQPPPPSNQI